MDTVLTAVPGLLFPFSNFFSLKVLYPFDCIKEYTASPYMLRKVIAIAKIKAGFFPQVMLGLKVDSKYKICTINLF